MVAEAARSRRLLAQSRRALWGAAKPEEEARTYLQQRLAVFCKLLFWSFVALTVFTLLTYEVFPTIKPKHQQIIYGVAVLALAILAFLWRILLVRRT